MRMGLGFGVNRLGPGGGAAWVPSKDTLGGRNGLLFIPRMETLSQDSAGSTPVTATTQPVGKILDLYGDNLHGTQSNSFARPVYEEVGGKGVLSFSGSLIESGAIDLSATNKTHIFAVAYLTSIGGIVFEVGAYPDGATFNQTAGRIAFYSANLPYYYAATPQGYLADGSNYHGANFKGVVSGDAIYLVEYLLDYSAGTNAEVVCKVNGVAAEVTNPSNGNLPDRVFGQRTVNLGGRNINGTSNYGFSGYIAAYMQVAGHLSDEDAALTRAYLIAQTGVVV